jgi:hypothetical protein
MVIHIQKFREFIKTKTARAGGGTSAIVASHCDRLASVARPSRAFRALLPHPPCFSLAVRYL